MSIARFISHIADASPAFRCYASGDREKSLAFVAILRHEIGPSASSKSLDQVRKWLGVHAEPFVDLYAKHNGCLLYQDSKGDAAGVWLYRIEDWGSQTGEMKSQFEAMGFSFEEQPVAVTDSLAFAAIPHSANYFTVKTAGPDSGRIFYADHDDFSDEPFAQSLDEFLERLVADPAQFLYDVGCYTRYSDGKSSKEWIPKQYAASVSGVGS